MALTDVAAKQAKPRDKAYKLADGAGLHLLIQPNGAKYWRLKYRIDGREKVLALGVYPEVSLATARARREDARKAIGEGIAPFARRWRPPSAPSMPPTGPGAHGGRPICR